MNNFTETGLFNSTTNVVTEQVQEISSITSTFMPIFYTLGLSSCIASAFYYLVKNFWAEIKKQTTSLIRLENDDPMFKYLQEYLSDNGFIKDKVTNVTASLERTKNKEWYRAKSQEANNFNPIINYAPSGGMNSFYKKGKKIFINQQKGQTITVGWERTPKTLQTIDLWCFGKKNLPLLKTILDEAYEYALKKDLGKTNIYALHQWWTSWDKVQSKEPRDFDSVILDTNIANDIVDDVRSFLNNKNWYINRGVPYRRGYLLYGPPGTGKTSFILALAGKIGLNLCTVNLSSNSLDDDKLNQLFESTPSNSIILMEDIDALFKERTSVQSKKGNQITFSGLLNALDGVRSQEGIILFMTTNHKERLDPALLRPGRADMHIELNYASQPQVKNLFLKFYPGENEIAEKFSFKVPEYQISMAKLQGHFLKNKNKPEKALKTVTNLFETEQFVKEMCIIDWLIRLGFEKHAKSFVDQDINNVRALQSVKENHLETFGIKSIGKKKIFMGMIDGDKDLMKQFKYMSENSIRGFFEAQFSNNSDFVKNLLQIVPEDCVTEFQLREIVENYKNLSQNKLQEKIKLLVKRNQALENNPELKLQYIKDFEEEIDFEINVEKILEELKLTEYLEKFKDQNILDGEMFLEVNDALLERTLRIEKYGDRKLIEKKINKLKKEKEELLDKKKEISLETFQFELEGDLVLVKKESHLI